jgi:hypothetical protein
LLEHFNKAGLDQGTLPWRAPRSGKGSRVGRVKLPYARRVLLLPAGPALHGLDLLQVNQFFIPPLEFVQERRRQGDLMVRSGVREMKGYANVILLT